MPFGMRLSNFSCDQELMYSFSTTEDTESTEVFRFAPLYDYPVTWPTTISLNDAPRWWSVSVWHRWIRVWDGDDRWCRKYL